MVHGRSTLSVLAELLTTRRYLFFVKRAVKCHDKNRKRTSRDRVEMTRRWSRKMGSEFGQVEKETEQAGLKEEAEKTRY